MLLHDVLANLVQLPVIFPYQPAGAEQFASFFQYEAPNVVIALCDVAVPVRFPLD
jgi:hypothetical protein